LGAELAITSETLRKARDAEAAHLDAVLKIDGAKALRLSYLLEQLRISFKDEASDLELKTDAGVEPQVWLDLSHRITMEPDAKTYRLSVLSEGKIDIQLETHKLDDMLFAAQKVFAHSKVRKAWTSADSTRTTKLWGLATLIYVWLTGVIAGIAGVALISIYMKKLFN
jgi:hypothetical protein